MPTRRDKKFKEFIQPIQKVCDDNGAELEDSGWSNGGHRVLTLQLGKQSRRLFISNTASCHRGGKNNRSIALRLINDMKNAI